ncbi:MAG: response regulator transcription factor [Fimbriiglobus sp.]
MRVLVVEDEPELLRCLAQALREDGYAVDEATTGDDGLSKAKSWDYDVILLDLMLPGIDGKTLLNSLRCRKRTPVLVLTARDTVQDRIQLLNAGADDSVVKPFNLGELLARVRALIRRSAGGANSLIAIHNVVVDTAQKQGTLAGETVVLTAREYAILEFLAVRRGKVLTKTQITEHIFDENDDTLSNLIEVHISNIRKKLGKDLIETRRGLGYIIHD